MTSAPRLPTSSKKSRGGSGRREPFHVVFSATEADALRDAAKAHGLTPGALARGLTLMAIDNDMIDAIFDRVDAMAWLTARHGCGSQNSKYLTAAGVAALRMLSVDEWRDFTLSGVSKAAGVTEMTAIRLRRKLAERGMIELDDRPVSGAARRARMTPAGQAYLDSIA